eukprot:63369-Prymnesium_polylepis.1
MCVCGARAEANDASCADASARAAKGAAMPSHVCHVDAPLEQLIVRRVRRLHRRRKGRVHRDAGAGHVEQPEGARLGQLERHQRLQLLL